MIYSKATGGLGNQLYTYAIGFALAKKYEDSFTIDLSQYRFSPRPYVLDHFTVSYPALCLFCKPFRTKYPIPTERNIFTQYIPTLFRN